MGQAAACPFFFAAAAAALSERRFPLRGSCPNPAVPALPCKRLGMAGGMAARLNCPLPKLPVEAERLG